MNRTQRAAKRGRRKILTKLASWMRNELGPFLIDIVLIGLEVDLLIKIVNQAKQA